MVKETRIVFSLVDISAIRIRCKACEGEVLCKPSRKYFIPEECPACFKTWTQGDKVASGHFLSHIRRIISQRDDSPFEFRFELVEDQKPISQ